MYQMSFVCTSRINLGLMINACVPLSSSRRLIFDEPVIALGITGKSLFAVNWEIKKLTRRPSVGLVSETEMFLWTPSPLVSGGPLSPLCSAPVRHSICLFLWVMDWCASRLIRLICYRTILTLSSPGSFDLPLTGHHSPSHTTFAFGSSEVGRLLWDLETYYDIDQLGMFPLIQIRTADVMVLVWCFDVFFVWVVYLLCWRLTNVTPIPKGSYSPSVANYQPITKTPVLSYVFERLVSVHHGRFMKRSGVIPTTEFAYWKGLGHVFNFDACSIHCKMRWRVGRYRWQCWWDSRQILERCLSDAGEISVRCLII